MLTCVVIAHLEMYDESRRRWKRYIQKMEKIYTRASHFRSFLAGLYVTENLEGQQHSASSRAS